MMFTLMAIAIVLVSCTLLGLYFNYNLNDAARQQLNSKAYYLAKGCSDIGVAALCADNNKLLDEVKNNTAADPLVPLRESTIVHEDYKNGGELGTSVMKLTREVDADSRVWAVLNITTTMPDTRANSTTGLYEYKYRVQIRTDLPSVRLYSIV